MGTVNPCAARVQVELTFHDDLRAGMDGGRGRVVDVVVDLELVAERCADPELLLPPVDAGTGDDQPAEGDLGSAATLGDVLVQPGVVGRDTPRGRRLTAGSGRRPQQRDQSDDRASAYVKRPSSNDFPRIAASAPAVATATMSSRAPIPPE